MSAGSAYLLVGCPAANDRDVLLAPHDQAVAIDELVAVQLEVGKVRNDSPDGDLRLHPGQGGAEAEVDSMAKAHVLPRAGQVESVRVVEVGHVTVRRPDKQDDQLTLRDPHAGQDDVIARLAEAELER